VIARRSVADVRQIPEKLIDVTLQPLMVVLLFACMFGGAIDVPGGDYRTYLIGSILVQSIAFGMVGPRTALATRPSLGGSSTATFAAPSSRLGSASARKKASVWSFKPETTASDQASAGGKSAPTALLHPWKQQSRSRCVPCEAAAGGAVRPASSRKRNLGFSR
jgi:hypothetical protein